jgi:hypothetical protein
MTQGHRAAVHIGLGWRESQLLHHGDNVDGELTLQGLLYPFRAASDDG